jgi:hypothetical protein
VSRISHKQMNYANQLSEIVSRSFSIESPHENQVFLDTLIVSLHRYPAQLCPESSPAGNVLLLKLVSLLCSLEKLMNNLGLDSLTNILFLLQESGQMCPNLTLSLRKISGECDWC